MSNNDWKVNTDYTEDFNESLRKINKLSQTPNTILDIALNGLNNTLKYDPKPVVKNEISKSIAVLENIETSSIQENFKIIYSQMCILAVSVLESILKKYFVNALKDLRNINRSLKDLSTIKLTLAELLEGNMRIGGSVGEIIIEKTKPNFQDLKSIKRIFKDYMSKDVTLTSELEKKICFYLELRHNLVHHAGIIDSKFIESTNNFKANIKPYKLGDEVDLSEDDWNNIKKCFVELVKEITKYNVVK